MQAFITTPTCSLGTMNFGLRIQLSFIEELGHCITTTDLPSPGSYIPLGLTNGGIIEVDPSWVPGMPIFGDHFTSCSFQKTWVEKKWTGNSANFFSIPVGRGRSKATYQGSDNNYQGDDKDNVVLWDYEDYSGGFELIHTKPEAEDTNTKKLHHMSTSYELISDGWDCVESRLVDNRSQTIGTSIAGLCSRSRSATATGTTDRCINYP
ncbi:hypothetical protein F5146DRAFT_998042 [Armillaria mellea]|nr:hypothetical protein F5146DRAFT_998042 [Armillaria mellea]